jgi:hypothetical protein
MYPNSHGALIRLRAPLGHGLKLAPLAHDAVRYTPEHGPSERTETSAPHDHHLSPDLLCEADDLGVRTTHRDVGSLDFAAGIL